MIDLSEFGEEREDSKVESILAKLTDDQREKVLAAAAKPKIPSTRIARVLTNWGFPVSHGTVERWRMLDRT